MKAIILAAGRGTRLSPLSETRPKSMIPVGGKPLLEHLLLSLKENGIRDVLVVIGYLGDIIRRDLGDGSHLGVHIQYVNQEKPLGTADALAASSASIGEADFLVIYGDLFVSPDAVGRLLEHKYVHETAMAIVEVDDVENYGVVHLSQDRVDGIVEKPSDARRDSSWVNAGIYRMNKSVFSSLKQVSYSARGDLELTDAVRMMIGSGKEILAVRIDSKDWMDVGRPWDLLQANERALKSLKREIKGTVEEGAHVQGAVYLGRGARIRSGAYVEGPVFIGEGCDIGPNCFIRPSTYLDREVRVGNACEIKNSMILARTHVGHLSYIGDSILGESCNLGAGTITANLRFDDANVKVKVNSQLLDSGRRKFGVVMGDHVKTGIHVSTMPGVKIGPNSWIGPSLLLTRDVGPNMLVSERTQHSTKSIK